MEEMTGIPAEQILGKADYEYALPFYHERRPITADLVLHDDPAVAAKYPFMKKEGNSLLAEIYIPHLNKGSGAYLWFKASPLYDAAGNISGAIESIRDITDKKRAEEELRDAHEKYTKAFLSAPDAIAISELDTGRFIEVNDAATRIFGYSRDELIGKSALELGILLKKEDRELLIDQVREQGRVSQFELSERRKSGELYNALINADTISIGNVPYLLTLVQDITDRKRAEQSAKENLVLYQTLSESAKDIIFICDSGGNLQYFNKNGAATFGVNLDDLIGKTLEQAFPPDIAREQRRQLDLVLESKKPLFTEINITLPKVNLWLDVQLIPLFTEQGTVKSVMGVARDITMRKRAEEALRESEERYREFFTISRDSVFITTLEGKWIDFNNALLEMFGFESREEMYEIPVSSVYAHPEERSAFNQRILRDGYVKEYPIQLKQKDGTVIDTIITTVSVRNPDGSPKAFIGTIRNVTEKKHAEEEIHTLQQFEESVIKNAYIWISVLDGKGNVSIWNQAAEEISGYKADEVIGKNTIWSRMYPDKEYRHTVTAMIKEIVGSKKYLENFETRIRTKDGQERIIWWNTRALQDIPGIDETFIAIGKDVTEQKTLSDALRQANKQLNLISSITRHDILNQLIALKGYLDLSRDILSDPVNLENYIIKEQDIANTIEEQIQFMKDYEDMGIKAPEWQNVYKSVEKARQSLPRREIAVETDSPTLEVYADPLLMRVFYNLIDNALRYGGEQMTAIRISSQESSLGLLIVCEDNGVGIPADKKEAIFRRRYFKHTGLGLFLSREILVITGITITENGTPGKGARFEITVPNGMWRREEANRKKD
jgi:PAS domain S-box-containing protein